MEINFFETSKSKLSNTNKLNIKYLNQSIFGHLVKLQQNNGSNYVHT